MSRSRGKCRKWEAEGGREGGTYLPVTKPVSTEGLINFISEPTRNKAMPHSKIAAAKETTAAIWPRT